MQNTKRDFTYVEYRRLKRTESRRISGHERVRTIQGLKSTCVRRCRIIVGLRKTHLRRDITARIIGACLYDLTSARNAHLALLSCRGLKSTAQFFDQPPLL